MDVRRLILKQVRQRGAVKTSDIVKITGFSRAYINRFLAALQNEGKVVLIGKANQALYVPAERHRVLGARRKIKSARRILTNKGLSEDIVLNDIRRTTGIFPGLSASAAGITEYAFTEMLNNAIEHSQSKKITVAMERGPESVKFEVADFGVGIFRHIQRKKGLSSELEAIQDLLKGKETTMPKRHSGEGIFFTSKAADILIVRSSDKKLIFNNLIDDIFLNSAKKIKGTKIIFSVAAHAQRNLSAIFKKYSNNAYEFSGTRVLVKLYRTDSAYVSRSQARRVVSGLEKFKSVILDFKRLDGVGQAFADEIFRMWRRRHPKIKIECKNANKNVEFMIKRAAAK